MTTEVTIPEAVGDWLLRGTDYETQLAGPITDTIIDAAAWVDARWKNGLPNWELYRAAIAGDNLYIPRVRQWVVAFTVAHCLSGGIKAEAYSEEFACVAAWDALHVIIYSRELQPTTVSATLLGVHHKTYRRLRDAIANRLAASLIEYRARLLVAMGEVKRAEYKCGSVFKSRIMGMRGSFFPDCIPDGSDGNYIRLPPRDSDNL